MVQPQESRNRRPKKTTAVPPKTQSATGKTAAATQGASESRSSHGYTWHAFVPWMGLASVLVTLVTLNQALDLHLQDHFFPQQDFGQSFGGPHPSECCLLTAGRAPPPLHRVIERCTDTHTAREAARETVLLTQVSPWIQDYGRWSVGLLGVYARLFEHTLIVESEREAPLDGREPRYAKVWFLREWMRHFAFNVPSHAAPRYLVWLDADAVLTDFQGDAVAAALARHLPPHGAADLAVGREFHGAVPKGGERPTMTNTGVLALRVGPWALKLLNRWWDAPGAKQGHADQTTFDELFRADVLGLQARTALMPSFELNGGLGTWESPAQQPVMHLFGVPNDVRERVFEGMLRPLCATARVGGRTDGASLASWAGLLRSTVLDAYLAGLQATATGKAGTGAGFLARFKLADGLMRNEELCAGDGDGGGDGEGPQRCSGQWGGAQEALAIYQDLDQEMVKGPHHPRERVRVLDKIAGALQTLGRLDDALQVLGSAEQVLAREMSAVGMNGPLQLAAVLNQQAAILTGMDRDEEALGKLEQALQMWEHVQGSGNHDLKRFLNNIAELLRKMGRSSEAEEYASRARLIH